MQKSKIGKSIVTFIKQKKWKQIYTDALHHIPGFTSKDIYNQTLDTRIISLYQLSKETYTAKELCAILLETNQNIYEVWKKEDTQVTE